jgi:hypothetical protein
MDFVVSYYGGLILLAIIIAIRVKYFDKTDEYRHKDFTIEYMETLGRYYPKVKDKYIKWWNQEITLLDDTKRADWYNNIEGARNAVQTAKEMLGVGNKIIKDKEDLWTS